MPAWGSPFDIFYQRLKSVKRQIWNKDLFSNIFDNVKKVEDKLLYKLKLLWNIVGLIGIIIIKLLMNPKRI